MNDLWLFVEHGRNKTWTRAQVPDRMATPRDLVGYLQRGGRVVSSWMDIPDRARFTSRAIGMTVIATLAEMRERN